MTWAQKFLSVRDEDLIANIDAIILRDFALALAVLYPGQTLPDFAESALGQVLGNEFPSRAIAPRSNASSPADDDGHLAQAFRVDLYVGVTDDSPANVTIRIMKYMTTLGEVLRSATKADMFTGMASRTFGYVFESEWEYGPIGSNDNILFRSAQMTATITVNSR